MGKIKTSVTSAYIACTTGKWYYSIELADSFLLKIDIGLLQTTQLALYERSFEGPASLHAVDQTQDEAEKELGSF